MPHVLPAAGSLGWSDAKLVVCVAFFAQLTTDAELRALSENGMHPVVLHFWAGWAPMCTQTKVRHTVLKSVFP